MPRKERVLTRMEIGWKEDEGDSKWIGMPVQLVSAHQITAPRNMPMAQSEKLCMAVYRRPKTIENVYMPRRMVRKVNVCSESAGSMGMEDATSEDGYASLWISAKRKRAMEMLLVEWVDGKPYSRWCVLIPASSDISLVQGK